jgi:hypothetical protein
MLSADGDPSAGFWGFWLIATVSVKTGEILMAYAPYFTFNFFLRLSPAPGVSTAATGG